VAVKEHETPEAYEDRYERVEGVRTLAALTPDIDGVETLMSSVDWKEQDRRVAELKARDVVMLERSRMLTRAAELYDNGFPRMFVDAAMQDLRDTEPMRQARLFVHLPKTILVLAGGVGAGKTTAAAWLSLKGQDPRPGFIRIAELERRGRYDKTLGPWLDDKTSLVIDDVGAEYMDGKGAFRSLLDEVIDVFYSNRRRLVMTTNLRPKRTGADEQEQFQERYGERVWSRLTQMGVWSDCGTRDLRKEKP
jgi:DNA replication protein DnaC